jgi:predicted signal transduction protein with EAL and GGDEF domain
VGSTTRGIGVDLDPEGFGTADEVVAAADTAMYEAKRRGGGRCALYSKDLDGPRRRRPTDESLHGPGILGDASEGLKSRR